MPSIKNIIDFYKDCYQSDVKAISITNFFGRNIDHPYTVGSLELLNGKLNRYPVDSSWGKIVDKSLTLYTQEKSLYCCSFFLKGKMRLLGKQSNVFTPLFIHEVSLILEDEVYYLEVDARNPIINPAFLEYLKTRKEGVDVTYDELNEILPKGLFQFEEILQMKEVFKNRFPNINVEPLERLLATDSVEQDLKKVYKSRSTKTDLKIIIGIGIGLIPKPTGSRGIINELKYISEVGDYSRLIKELFQASKGNNKIKFSKREILSPISLSSSQINVFHALDCYSTTLVIGPPGTGKSFTISALVTDLISKGKSVLIASKNNQAGKVISDMIEQDFDLKGVVIKTAKKTYRNSLKRRLENIIHGLEVQRISELELQGLKYEITNLTKEIKQLENTLISKEQEELKWGSFFYQYRDTFFNRFKKQWIKYKHNSNQPIWEIKLVLDKKKDKLNRKIKKYIKRKYDYHLYGTLNTKRKEIKNLVEAMNQDVGSLMQEYFDRIDFRIILKALPAWICNTSEIHKILPLRKELFDVLIIDEATQCDIPSSIPLLQRAKKVVIVGDPKQLRHISFLSKKQQKLFAEKYKLDFATKEKNNYRAYSILDLISKSIDRQDQVVFLNEHYRSMPDIIQFSNGNFYAGKLRIMTSTPISLKEKSVFLHQVNGQRNIQGQNEKEIEAIIKKVKAIIAEESHLEKAMCQSIGILSPFRPQISLVKAKLRKQISLIDFKRHRILIGTPYHFQGEERDVMLISFVIDKDTHPSTFIYLNREDVFNVSITRARSVQHIYSSISHKETHLENLFTKYLASIDTKRELDLELSNYKYIDDFIEEIADVIRKWGVDKIYKSYPIAGIEVDLVVVNNNKTYCIDLIGYPGEFENQFPLENWNILERMNIKVFSLPYSSWYLDHEKCISNLYEYIFENKTDN